MPSWMITYIEDKAVEDEIRYLDLGFQDEREFFTYELKELGLSYIDNWET